MKKKEAMFNGEKRNKHPKKAGDTRDYFNTLFFSTPDKCNGNKRRKQTVSTKRNKLYNTSF
jgi:hypothetical protein